MNTSLADPTLARYSLPDGTIHNWLACGPVISPLKELSRVFSPTGPAFGKKGRWILNYWAYDPASAGLKKRLYGELPPFTWKPGARPHLNAPAIAGKSWAYAVAEEDRVIDFSLFNFSPALMQGWLFACLEAEHPLTAQAELFTIGPARVWLNGVLQKHFDERFSYVALQTIPLTLNLSAGLNELCLHGEMFGWREARLALGLRFPENPPVSVRIPLGEIGAAQWHRAEDGLAGVVVKQFAFPDLPGRLSLAAHAAPFGFEAEAQVPLPEFTDAVISEGVSSHQRVRLSLQPSESAELPITPEVARAMAVAPGENTLTLRLRPADGTPLQVERVVWASANRFSAEPYGDYESRRREALEHLAQMPYDIPASMAAVEVGKRTTIDSEAIRVACHFLNNRYDCADFYAIGLLALLTRFGAHPALRPADRELIETAFRNFKFWIDEPGLDAMCYFTENHQILFHVTAYLAGQHWPDRVFSNSGWTGRQQKERAKPRIESWIQRRLRGNFSEWDSNAYMALDVFAMLALVEYADSPRLRELATALLDKIFFLVACQSFRGSHGSTHGRCYVTGLKSARVENTSNLQRIAWGMGILNGETRATALLAMARRYRVSPLVQQIGADLPDVLVTRARSHESYRPQFDMKPGFWDVRTITRRTPDGMLSAAIDHRPGAMGVQEHLWQATLGPDAVVFTTYPGNSQEHGNARPNFWAGSARLPRVAMHGRAMLCLYRFEPGVGLGFSHAYFPMATFDETLMRGPWAFARLGNGYVALRGDGDLVLTETGRHAGQELRSRGAGQVWIGVVGRAVEDGDFGTFCDKLTRSACQIEGSNVTWASPDGHTLAFGWEGPLRVDGQTQDFDDFPHYENLYTNTPMGAQSMTLRFGQQEQILKFT